MSRRLEKMNKQLQRVVGEILQAEVEIPPGVLVTISRVETTANFRSATVWLSVFPSQAADDVMERIKALLYDLQRRVNNTMKMRVTPRLFFRLDHGAEKASDLETVFKKLD